MTDINTTYKATIQPVPDDRPVYEPPRATRLGDTHPGAGACAPGSGDAACVTGGTAGMCMGDGNGASVFCDAFGNLPT